MSWIAEEDAIAVRRQNQEVEAGVAGAGAGAEAKRRWLGEGGEEGLLPLPKDLQVSSQLFVYQESVAFWNSLFRIHNTLLSNYVIPSSNLDFPTAPLPQSYRI